MKKEIKIPDIAENVETGLIAGILVAKGDKISKDQPVVEIETDKATTDIPSPFAGTVDEIKVKEGDEVKVNQVIMIIETEGEGEGEGKGKGKDKEEEEGKGKEKEEKEESDQEEEEDSADEKEEEEESAEDEQGENEDEDKEKKQDKETAESKSTKEKRNLSAVPAAPSVRRLAREMDVDITEVEGSGPGNRITAEDVKNYSGKTESKKEQETGKTKLPGFSQWGPTSSEPMSTIRKITSKNVQQAWQTIPHVTQFDEADITDLENFRKQNQAKMEKEGVKLTVTSILLKIAGFALQKFPRFNASIDAANDEIIYKHFYNIGVAVDTPKGLLVPVIRDVNKKSLKELSLELTELAQKARDKKIAPEEMQGGNFTISNLGGIGGTAFTPIVLPPQVAILGVSRAAYKQVFIENEFKKRLVIPLSLSYDHRVIDGADGARFLRWICEVIEDPYALLQ